ncbi:MaoC/PaaZ C-terminal domain-containing protein [Microvirga splendida]|uniref:MaoC family dehydratase N-terminal domain-containing protein n=1 Tax=Microvirga splendida TaxID=2795727 RepID=A0ABS0Y741_9HYPH|nr:MaoC/PaaZ C-terminal domain-containing protein [Microvirga splendida]MBJ6128108.1 MaoC family dehydratase N-terminal domain-containing protein [Microvirga splendida]
MPLDPEKLFALRFPEIRQTYTWRDSVIYALGLGFGLDPVDERQLGFVVETKLKAVPTMANILAYPGFWMRDLDTGIDWVKVVHGEHAMRLHRPLQPEGEIVGRTRIVDLVDKGEGKGALVYAERVIADAATGEKLATLLQTVFCRSDGGFGGKSEAPHVPHAIPERVPDLSVDMPTHSQMALIYRLSGDFNPLHADPVIARAAGYERPILHGLATYGVACHGLMKALCEYEPERVQTLQGRFSAPVFPGETITIDIWREVPGRAAFRARIASREAVVFNNGLFEYAA